MTGYSPDPRHLGSGPGRSPPATTLLARAARYARWDGTQSIPALDADEILDALADDVMAEGDLGEALRRLMERGWRGRDPTRADLAGLSDLREQAAPPPGRAPGALQRRRRAGRRPGGAGGDRRRRTGRHRAPPRRSRRDVRRRRSRVGPGAPQHAPGRGRPPAGPARGAAARHRPPDPVARGVRLHGAERPRAVPGADRAAPPPDARPLRRRPVAGDPGHDAGGAPGEPRDGPRPELAARGAARGPGADARTRSTTSSRSTAGSSRAPGRSTTSSSS